ncbi:MAG: YbaK/EbsC family protein [bacterium]
MPISKKIINSLKGKKHAVITHKKVFTAYDLAATLEKELNEVAKALLVELDKQLAVAFLPASHNLDFKKLAKLSGAKKVSISKENVIKKKVGAEPGTLPAFQTMVKLPFFAEKALLKCRTVHFPAGSFTECIAMSPKDWAKLNTVALGSFGSPNKILSPIKQAVVQRKEAAKTRKQDKLKRKQINKKQLAKKAKKRKK